jgi:hypothetical protein
VGYVRDVGALVRFTNSQGKAMVGLFNGNGESQTSVDPNRQHFASFNAYWNPPIGPNKSKPLTLGVWGGMDIGDAEPEFKKDRLGTTFIYQQGQHLFEAEGAYTRDYSPLFSTGNYTGTEQGSNGRGGYTLYGYTVTNRFQVVGRFDVWDPAYQAGQTAASVTTVGGYTIPRQYHDLREYTLGMNYYLFGKKPNGDFDQRFKVQLNYIVDAVEKNGVSFWGKSRNLLIANFQAAF